jgi:hypothetical protein
VQQDFNAGGTLRHVTLSRHYSIYESLLFSASRDIFKMKVPPEDRRVSSRMNQQQTVRIRPAESRFIEEIRTTLNVSWDGFYFATSLGHYVPGMAVFVTRDFQAIDPKKREEQGTVVRVDQLKVGRWGVAVQITRDVWTNRIT